MTVLSRVDTFPHKCFRTIIIMMTTMIMEMTASMIKCDIIHFDDKSDNGDDYDTNDNDDDDDDDAAADNSNNSLFDIVIIDNASIVDLCIGISLCSSNIE